VRSLRALHDRGLLPPPILRGRTGFYDEQHLARARLVINLQQRGFTLPAVAQLLTAWESGRDISQVLGLEAALTKPWGERQPGRATVAELEARLGAPLGSDQVSRMVKLGVLAPHADGDYTMPAPELIEAGIQMVRAGIRLDRVLDLTEWLRADMFEVARKVTAEVGADLVSGETADGLPAGDLKVLLDGIAILRRQAQESIGAWFTLGMDKALADYVASLGDRVTERDRQKR
jgi:DNA-binding transcriptional MerR regulator